MNPKKLAEIKERSLELGGALFTSGPVSPLAIISYLVRLEPYSGAHVRMQSGRFDPDRSFNSLRQIWVANFAGADCRELVPEFFYAPEFFVNINKFEGLSDVALPAWAESPLAFVYLHRKALESDQISAQLHKWIDLVWGINQRNAELDNVYEACLYSTVWTELDPADAIVWKQQLELLGQIPPPLFKLPHPARKVVPETEDGELVKIGDLSAPIAAICIGESSSTKITVYGIACEVSSRKPSHSSLLSFAVDLNAKGAPNPSQKKSLPAFESVKSCSDGFVVQFPDHSITHLRPSKETVIDKTVASDHRIVSVACSGEWMFAVSDDFVASVWTDYREEPVSRTRIYRGPVVCSAVSATWKVCVCGTEEGEIVISTLDRGEAIRAIQLEKVTPIYLAITHAWGFILAYCWEVVDGEPRYWLVVYTLNGEFVRKKSLDGKILGYGVFSSMRGFDYFGYFVGRQFYVCEVFFLKPRRVGSWITQASVKQFAYESKLGRFLFLDENQGLYLLHFVPNDFEELKPPK
jgi:hypothetical protein